MLARIGVVILIALISQSCLQKMQQRALAMKSAKSPYEQLDFHSLARRYAKKDHLDPVEGIYSVSGSVTKKGKGFLSASEKEKITDRQDNYAKVLIIKDEESTGREYIEISLDKENLVSYSIVGEFNIAANGSLLVYKHLDSKKKGTSFTFTIDRTTDILEGIRVDNEGNSTVTYKLTYVKLK